MLRRLRRRTSTVTDLSKNSRYPSLAGAVLFPILLLIIWTQKTNHKLFHCVLDPTFTGVFSFSLSLGIPYGASQGAGHIQEEFGGAERRQKGAVQHPTRPLTLRGMLSSYKKSSTWISVKWAVSWIQHKSSSLLLLTWREVRPPKTSLEAQMQLIFFCVGIEGMKSPLRIDQTNTYFQLHKCTFVGLEEGRSHFTLPVFKGSKADVAAACTHVSWLKWIRTLHVAQYKWIPLGPLYRHYINNII